MPAARTALLLALLLSTLASAQPRPTPPIPAPPPLVNRSERTLRVEGTGEVKAAPDEAFLDLAVETEAPTAKAAAAENARKMDKVVAALVRAGLARQEIQTRNYTVYPDYPPQTQPGEAPKLRGYRVSNTVEVHVRELTRVGELLDTALNAGANQVQSVSFGLSKPETVQGEALRNAVERARQSAQVLAASLGVKLGPVLEASTVTEPLRLVPLPLRMEAKAAVTTPIEPQEQTVQATVMLLFALEPGPGR